MPDKINKKLIKTKIRGGLNAMQINKTRRDELINNLNTLIEGALFLEDDKIRKKLWQKQITKLSIKQIQELSEAIIRENFRWKKNLRKITFFELSNEIINNLDDIIPKNQQTIDDLYIREKNDLDKYILPENKAIKLNLDQSSENQDNLKSLDKIGLILIMAISEIFEKSGWMKFYEIMENLKKDPVKYAFMNPRTKDAFLQIKQGIDKWPTDFKNDWSKFIDSVAISFLQAKDTECQLLGIPNEYHHLFR